MSLLANIKLTSASAMLVQLLLLNLLSPTAMARRGRPACIHALPSPFYMLFLLKEARYVLRTSCR
jgi:hypothetical protein